MTAKDIAAKGISISLPHLMLNLLKQADNINPNNQRHSPKFKSLLTLKLLIEKILMQANIIKKKYDALKKNAYSTINLLDGYMADMLKKRTHKNIPTSASDFLQNFIF